MPNRTDKGERAYPYDVDEHDDSGSKGVKRTGTQIWNTDTLDWERYTGKSPDVVEAVNEGSADIVNKLDTLEVTANVDLTQLDRTNYMFYDDAEDTNYDYIAKQSAAGSWYIMRIPKTGVNDITKYAVGSSDLATAWASFATQTYADWDTNNSPTSSGVLSMAGMATEAKQLPDNHQVKVSNESLAVVEILHEHIHKGRAFTAFDVVPIASGASYVVIVNTNDTVTKHSYLQAYLSEELEITVNEGVTTTSDGTIVPIINRNRNSSNTSTADIHHTPTGLVTTGTVVTRHARVGSKSALAESKEDNEFILKSNTKYAVTFINRGNTTAYLNWQWIWYEYAI